MHEELLDFVKAKVRSPSSNSTVWKILTLHSVFVIDGRLRVDVS
jgi:hypothetical protein